MRRALTLVFLAVVCILVAALLTGRRFAHQDGPSAVRRAGAEEHFAFDKGRATIPFIFVYMYPKYPLPGDDDVVGGLKVAVWQDGKVVRARTASEVGEAYIQGRLEPQQIAELIRSIERSGILATQQGGIVREHAAFDVLKIRTLGELREWNHSVPEFENALVKQIEEMLMTIDIRDVGVIKWRTFYPDEWDNK